MTEVIDQNVKFSDMGLPEQIVKAITEIGYENATPIQTQTIPHLLAGKDILGLAQTGSGKTASFLLPFLSKITTDRKCQLLVLAPTRELAIQVAKAAESFTTHMPKINVLSIYGGQPYGKQIKSIKDGAQVIIATPGRLIDHLEKGTLSLDSIKSVVLDEADEMLSMGFVDDLEIILSKLSEEVQTALFSATMPRLIETLTKKYLKDPVHIKIKSEKGSEPKIEQFYWLVNGYRKNEALIRFLEVEDYDASIIFCKTRQGCIEVTEFLDSKGFNAAALHGDMSQENREYTLNSLRNGRINILIATDIAARGLDIDRIDLVINYDPPTDNEAYVHRIGRTGRAGRSGRAIIFISNSEKFALYRIEQTIKKEINPISVPSNRDIENLRRKKFRIELEKKLNDHNLEKYEALIDEIIPTDFEPHQVLGALLSISTEKRRLILGEDLKIRQPSNYDRQQYSRGGRRNDRSSNRNERRKDNYSDRSSSGNNYYLAIGKMDGVETKHIIGALVNTSNIDSGDIGQVKILEKYTIVSFPKGISADKIESINSSKIKGRFPSMRLFSENKGNNDSKDNSYNSRSKNNKPSYGNKERFSNRSSEGSSYKERSTKKNKDRYVR